LKEEKMENDTKNYLVNMTDKSVRRRGDDVLLLGTNGYDLVETYTLEEWNRVKTYVVSAERIKIETADITEDDTEGGTLKYKYNLALYLEYRPALYIFKDKGEIDPNKEYGGQCQQTDYIELTDFAQGKTVGEYNRLSFIENKITPINTENILREIQEFKDARELEQKMKELRELVEDKSPDYVIINGTKINTDFEGTVALKDEKDKKELIVSKTSISFELPSRDEDGDVVYRELKVKWDKQYKMWVIVDNDMNENWTKLCQQYIEENLEEINYILSDEPKRQDFLMLAMK
jgi:hypothetical protein